MATALAKYRGGVSAPKGGVAGLWKSYTSLKKSKDRIKQKSEEAMGQVVESLVISGSAFVFGALQGAYYDPNPKVKGDKPGLHLFNTVPVELAAGVGLNVLSLLGWGGNASKHFAAAGNGAVAAYMSNLGRGWGYKFQKERAAKKSSTSGDISDAVNDLLAD